jgi:tRNA (mo5U34)-methyltransferase
MGNKMNTKKELVESYNGWWHSIDFGDGVISKGEKGHPNGREAIINTESWLDGIVFKDNRVLDIGAWDGYYSFYAERQGAKEVVAIDGSIWRQDFSYRRSKKGFDIAKTILNSKVKDYIENIEDMTPEKYGTFDIILFLGVLYHLQNPMLAIKNINDLLNKTGKIVIETTTRNNDLDKPVMEFHHKNSLNNDNSNWWSPNILCIEQMFNGFGKYIINQYKFNRAKHRVSLTLEKIS